MDLLDVGDLVYLYVENDQVKLDQIPQAQSSLISFNPKTGEVLSYVGGSVFNDSQLIELDSLILNQDQFSSLSFMHQLSAEV